MSNFFASLLESLSAVTEQPPVDAEVTEIAYVLAQCCALTYELYLQGIDDVPTTGTLQGANGNTFDYAFIGPVWTTSDALGQGANAQTPGAFVDVPIGFAAVCTNRATGARWNALALRGTQTFEEWFDDAEAVPAQYLVGNNNGNGYAKVLGLFRSLGFVHGGFYNRYTAGADGSAPTSSQISGTSAYQFSRPDGSVAAQVANALFMKGFDATLPLYVTGHSLGAALAVLCAMDVGTNFPTRFPAGQLSMINFAGPRVGIEMTLDGISISGLGETNPFVDNYASAVTTNILVVNATDLAPIVPPSSLALGVASVSYQQVSGTTLTFCVQTGSIGGNHSLADTYQPYAQQLADGLQPRRAAAPRSRAARPRQRVLEWARGLLWASFAQTNSASVERIGP